MHYKYYWPLKTYKHILEDEAAMRGLNKQLKMYNEQMALKKFLFFSVSAGVAYN